MFLFKASDQREIELCVANLNIKNGVSFYLLF